MKQTGKNVIVTERAPKAIGPYSVGISANGFVFTSGQLGLDPASGAFAAGGIEAETRQALTNLKAVLEAAGSSLDNVLKTTVFLRDIADCSHANRFRGAPCHVGCCVEYENSGWQVSDSTVD